MESMRKAAKLAGSVMKLLAGPVLGLAFLGLMSLPAQASTGVNEQVNFQARLFNSQGATVPDGTYNMEFKIYQDGDGVPGSGASETLKWTETRTSTDKVTVKNGYFSVYLGSVTAFGSSVDWNQDTLWLSINIGGTGSPSWDGEMSPYKRLGSNPYSINSGKLGGLSAAQFIQMAQGIQTDSSNTNASIAIDKTGSANLLQFRSGGTDVMTVSSAGDVNIARSSGTAFQVQKATGSDTLFTVDSTNNRVKIGNATASAGADSTLFVLDSASTTNKPTGVNGGMYYDTTLNKFQCYENSAWVNCGVATLQSAYNASANPEILLGSASTAGLTVKDNASPISGNLLEVQDSTGGTTYLAVTTTGLATSGDIEVTGADVTTASTGTAALFNTNATTLNIGGATTTLNLAGGSGSSGCTINSSGNLACTGDVTGGSTGTMGFWSRSGTTVQPANSGDALTTSGNISTTSSGTITAAGTLNANATGKTAVSIADSGAQNSGLTIGGDTNLYRSTANQLQTDDGFIVQPASASATAFQVLGASSYGNLPVVSVDTTNNNLIGNPSMEVDVSGYSAAGGSGLTRTTSEKFIGNAAGSVTTAGAWTGIYYGGLSLTAGQRYTMSGYFKASSPMSGGMALFWNDGADQNCTQGTTGVPGTAGWTLVSCTFTATSGTTSIKFAQNVFDSAVRTLYFDGIQLVPNNSVLPYQEGLISLGGKINSPVTFQNQTNSSTAFQIQNSYGVSALSVDTLSSNLLSNPNFEGTDISAWTVKGSGPTLAQDVSTIYLGNDSLKVSSVTSGTGVKYDIPFGTGSFTLAFSVKATLSSGTTSTAFEVGYNNGTTDTACTLNPTLANQPVSSAYWTRYYCTFTPGSNLNGHIYWKTTSNTITNFYLDAVQLRLSNVPGGFSDGDITVNGNLQSRGPVANVRAFGAKGDNTNDDTTAIQAAIDSVMVNGGQVYLPAGTYKITQTITLRSKVYISGDGIEATTVRLPNSANKDMFKSEGFDALTSTDSTGGINSWGIRDMTLDGNYAGGAGSTTGHCIRVYGFSYTLSNLVVHHCAQNGIYSEWSTAASVNPNMMEASLNNVKSHHNGYNGIEWAGPHDSKFNQVVAFVNGPATPTSTTNKGVWIRSTKNQSIPGGGTIPDGNVNGMRIVNSNSYGSPQTHAWQIENYAILSNVTGGQSSSAEFLFLYPLIQVTTADADCSSGTSVGFQFGDATHAVSGISLTNAEARDCSAGSFSFSNDSGNETVEGLASSSVGGSAVVGTSSNTNNLKIISSGQTGGIMSVGWQSVFKAATNQSSAFSIQNNAAINLFNVNTLGAPAYNQISNADFEGNINGWTKKGAATVANDSSSGNSKFGAQSLKLTTTAATTDGAQYSIPLTASTSYSISLWAKVTTASPPSLILGRQENGSDVETSCSASAPTQNVYTQYTCSFTTGSTINPNSTNIYIRQSTATASTIYLDGATFVAGATPLSYTQPGQALQVDGAYNNVTLNSGNNAALQPWNLGANGITTPGTTTLQPKDQISSVTSNGYYYVLGGYDGTNAFDSVYYAKLNADGSLGTWSCQGTTGASSCGSGGTGLGSNPLPAARRFVASVIANGYIYAIGGADTGGTAQSTIYYAKLNGDGSTGAWQTNTYGIGQGVNGSATALLGTSAVVRDGYIYLAGGCKDTTCTNTSTGVVNTIYKAKLYADGSIGPMSATTQSLTQHRGMGAAVIANGSLYYIGGSGASPSSGPNSTIYYAPIAANGDITTAFAQSGSIGNTSVMHTAVVADGYLYVMGGCTAHANFNCTAGSALSTVSYSKIYGDGTLSWAGSTSLPDKRAGHASAIANGYIYVAGGIDGGTPTRRATVYYASTPRTTIAGTLDLVGLTSQSLSDFGGGGALTAGNGRFIGDLKVDGFVDLNNGLSVDSAISINAIGSDAGQTVFNINNTNSNSIFSVRHMGTNFGSFVKAGAVEGRNSYFGDEFNAGMANTTTCVGSTTRGDFGWGVGDYGNHQSVTGGTTCAATNSGAGEFTFSGKLGATTASGNQCDVSTPNSTNGIIRLNAKSVATASNNSNCLISLASNLATTSNKILLPANLPVMSIKMKMNTLTASNNNLRISIGMSDLDNAQTNTTGASPANGIYFSNCSTESTTSGSVSGCSNTTWYGHSFSSSTDRVVTCSTGSGTNALTSNYSYLRMEVRSTTDIHFYADYNTSDGINEVECGTGLTAGPSANMTPYINSAVATNTAETVSSDIDYIRSWQDDNVAPPEDVVEDAPNGEQLVSDAPIVADTPTEGTSSFFDFGAATDQDVIFHNDVYVKGTLYADKIKANQIEGLEVYTDQLASLQEKLNQDASKSAGAGDSSVVAVTSTPGGPVNLNTNGAFTFSGPAEFQGNALFMQLVTFVEKTIFKHDVQFAGHITTDGTAPQILAGDGAGSTIATEESPAAKAEIRGNDNAGQISLVIGENPVEGDIASATFAKPFANTPQVYLTPTNGAAARLRYYVVATPTGFKVVAADQPTAGSNLKYNYLIIQ